MLAGCWLASTACCYSKPSVFCILTFETAMIINTTDNTVVMLNMNVKPAGR